MRAVIFANGHLENLESAQAALRNDDLIIAADGGARHCRALGLMPEIVVGDFDSLEEDQINALEISGVKIVRYPTHKDFNDLELALRTAVDTGATEVLVLGALGGRWDQSLADILLPASADFAELSITLLEGGQEFYYLRAGQRLQINAQTGDTLALIPLAGEARGITLRGLEYPLFEGSLHFGSTKGISNVFLGEQASISLQEGLLLCIVQHREQLPV